MDKSRKTLFQPATAKRPVELGFEAARLAESEARRKLVVEAAARVLAIKGYGPHSRAAEVNLLLPKGARLHSDHALRAATGGWRGLLARMGEGGLFPRQASGPASQWSEGLVVGLRLSGGLTHLRVGGRHRAATWVVRPAGRRPALEGALSGGLPWACEARVAGPGLMLYRFWAGNLGTGDPGGADVVAGLLMGAEPVGHGGRSWLGVPSTPGARALVESWGIPRGFLGLWKGGRGRVDLVSPFWGALFAWMMPGGMGGWFMGMARPGMCPLLPWAFLRMGGGRVSDGFPRKGLPFLTNRDALYAAGVPLGRCHEAAVRELGFVRLDPRLRAVWAGHMASLGLVFPFPH